MQSYGKYDKIILKDNIWVITEKGKNYLKPKNTYTFAFDTETLVYFDNEIIQQKEMLEKLKNLTFAEKKQRVTTSVWSWQVYDEFNGFFMTNDFYTFLYYICLIKGKFGWCYNAKFDFAQIDYKLLVEDKTLWKQHSDEENTKKQNWTFSSLHSDMGARYSLKLWTPYKRKGKSQNRHTMTHAVEFRDFMNIMAGGLERVLKSLDVKDNQGNEVRKLKMEYQAINQNELEEHDINYCCNDVKGLYFAVKKYNETLQEQSNNEDSIFGKNTNVLTAGGIAKRALLRELYSNETTSKKRLKKYQKEHPLTIEQDKFLRDNGLYRGGICLVNPFYQGKLLNKTMYRFDVNSEYPYAMSIIKDLKGKPIVITYSEWLKKSNEDKSKYECVLILESVTGELKENMIATWYDPFKKKYVDIIDERQKHLIFLNEFNEMQKWYDMEYIIENVILWKRGKEIYKPFVDKYYALKTKAKQEKNAGLTADSKLKLNSSYGKLSERIERNCGIYCENEETGCVHFVRTDTEIDETAQMNVAVGALITSTARVWILSHIREICPNVKKDFIYIDTDSIHTFNNYENADAFKLGGFKLEATCVACKYLAPKTYIDIEEIKDDKAVNFECHTKGVNINTIVKDLNNKSIDYIDNRFNYGERFICLQAINVKGGKALIPVEKYLAKEELRPNVAIYNHDGYNIEYEI